MKAEKPLKSWEVLVASEISQLLLLVKAGCCIEYRGWVSNQNQESCGREDFIHVSSRLSRHLHEF
jgi:hypothetical protein